MKNWPTTLLGMTLAAGMTATLAAGDLRFSDPDRQAPPPAGAIGYPSRDARLNALPGFRNPPPGYGEVAFYWWLGDPLKEDRLRWELDQLKNKGITALQVNYAHSDKGGQSWGLTYESDPKLFSEPWWKLFGWFLKEARTRGMAVALSDYTLGWPGQGWYFDEILKETPEAHGAVLAYAIHDCTGGAECFWELPAAPLSVAAYRKASASTLAGPAMDLGARVAGRTLHWTPAAGHWRVVEVHVIDKPVSLDPMNPASGPQMIAKFFQRFEDRNPGESGRGLDFFFSDELSFGVRGWLWNRYFAGEFRKRKGYDILPELAALFVDAGPRTPKVRLDYSDVMVSLEEEHYFRPLYEWHRSRGMMYGCDHGGRGRDVTEFGDYFRTQRWMTGPGNDQPGLASDIIKDKVSSSITHLYQRQRTWLEGYYGSGWGTSSADLVDATWRNFVLGQNLLTLHGLYYSTHGGWWEWAPPGNHFRMPYWAHMGEFPHATGRMSYLLSQGHHHADVAILYPVAAVEAGMDGGRSVKAAFNLGEHLFNRGIDFDFMDFESLARAKVEDRALEVSGESYRVLVLPSMRAVRFSTLQKAAEFHRGGGIVVALGDLPEASDRAGRDDPEVRALVREVFAKPQPATPAAVEALVNQAFPRDFVCPAAPAASPRVLHRKVGPRDVYMVYGAPKGTECSFRAAGRVELWDPWTGETSPLPVLARTAGSTRLHMPLDASEAQLIVFSPGKAEFETPRPTTPPETIAIGGSWEFELKPALDNRWGDYRLPATDAFIGAEARRFRYAEETSPNPGWQKPSLDDSAWTRATYTYGPRFWKLGPLPENLDATALERQLAAMTSVDVSNTVEFGGKRYHWQPYEYSLRWGVEDDAGHQGYHGLKAQVPDTFIALGRKRYRSTDTVYEAEPGGKRYYLWSAVVAPRALEARLAVGGERPTAVWIHGAALPAQAAAVPLGEGATPVLLRYDQPGSGYFALEDAAAPLNWSQTYPLASNWYNRPGLLPFDALPQVARPAGWYRFTSPPGLRALTITARGDVQVWADGTRAALTQSKPRADGACEYRGHVPRFSAAPVRVAIRVQQERGWYGGAAMAEPVLLDCGPGTITAGDWSQIDGLASYSGGAWYRKTITIEPRLSQKQLTLDLGGVRASAEVWVNGQRAGVRLAPPWRIGISQFAEPGTNRLEILVFNTLANHYQTIPTRYRGSPRSGLLGPVTLEAR